MSIKRINFSPNFPLKVGKRAFKKVRKWLKGYKNKGVLVSLDANGTFDEVWERLLEVIK